MKGPDERQEQLFWKALTALSWCILALVGLGVLWVVVGVLNFFQNILIPVGLAGVVAYILHPVICLLERWKIRRTWAVLLVMGAFAAVLIFSICFVVPIIIEQSTLLISALPGYIEDIKAWMQDLLVRHPGINQQLNHFDYSQITQWMPSTSAILKVVFSGLNSVFQMFGLILGIAFIPLYVFYFLRDQARIEARWKDFVPLQKSFLRDEITFILSETNNYLIVFFRGQVIIAMIIGILTALGLTIIGLNYGFLIGMVCGVLSIIPYLGIFMSIIPAMLIGYFQGGWILLIGVLGVFAFVQFLEGMFITPRIMGKKSGLHPVTVILSILVWTSLMGGILGGLLAIPLTATLKVLMFRYIWREESGKLSHEND